MPFMASIDLIYCTVDTMAVVRTTTVKPTIESESSPVIQTEEHEIFFEAKHLLPLVYNILYIMFFII